MESVGTRCDYILRAERNLLTYISPSMCFEIVCGHRSSAEELWTCLGAVTTTIPLCAELLPKLSHVVVVENRLRMTDPDHISLESATRLGSDWDRDRLVRVRPSGDAGLKLDLSWTSLGRIEDILRVYVNVLGIELKMMMA